MLTYHLRLVLKKNMFIRHLLLLYVQLYIWEKDYFLNSCISLSDYLVAISVSAQSFDNYASSLWGIIRSFLSLSCPIKWFVIDINLNEFLLKISAGWCPTRWCVVSCLFNILWNVYRALIAKPQVLPASEYLILRTVDKLGKS